MGCRGSGRSMLRSNVRANAWLSRDRAPARAPRRQQSERTADHETGPENRQATRPGESPVHAVSTERTVGGGHHLRAEALGVGVCRVRARCVLTFRSRLAVYPLLYRSRATRYRRGSGGVSVPATTLPGSYITATVESNIERFAMPTGLLSAMPSPHSVLRAFRPITRWPKR